MRRKMLWLLGGVLALVLAGMFAVLSMLFGDD